MARNPYILPGGYVQIAVSGGRSSAYMLHQILEANGDLPPRIEVTFQNTGRERPETLDFVAECASRWGVMITWLEYRPDAPFYEVIGRQGASMNGEPFAALIRKRRYLPNVVSRFCTTELKIRTAKRYLRARGWDHWTNAVGFRADEPHRLNKPKPKDRWTVWHPMATANVSRHDVAAFWDAQPFDLALPHVNGRCVDGNCDGCFLKSEAALAALARDEPDRHGWWENMEASFTGVTTSPAAASFNKTYRRAELREYVERQGDWLFNTTGALCQAEGGECFAI